MNEVTVELRQALRNLNLTEAAQVIEQTLMEADSKEWTCRQFLQWLLQYEMNRREEKQLAKRFRWALFPEIKRLDDFMLEEQQSLSRRQFNQLRELLWLEQNYNLIFLGPPGVGKTHLAIGLGVEALKKGYRVSFITMDGLIQLLKTETISRVSGSKLKRLYRSQLVIMDDLMFMAMDRYEANLFFQFINKLYGQSSIILTSNKGPDDWGELLGDPAITTAILDRILHKSEIIQLQGDSYRLKHRQTIFS
ncbi:IS21-like element helper ATPase IstB [Paenibacillus hexagrammi]|uniref:IS21-like element helper ATPase IstB n=1 Tax=Paenibacillus hexagrammi TaxID=2908839 RepID=A0ABY3SDQ2_9BACL|nr:IS21-like element helper ATPase IstB [Paenibacillus sp. YPD9-1]UJF31240.1 IS21-like element helper ATPase IstB [Paenibacillus sp. YPD9-1]UJF35187.1 IS21-like element helper ATPase IstB [Paenibacillus sp. YPD9-1]UJF35518.1 IS21-like element helper ATPase IstB [Paenibacillus sp. YPD9-1]